MQDIITFVSAFVACIAAEYAWHWYGRREWKKREQQAQAEREQARMFAEMQAQVEARAIEKQRQEEVAKWRRKVAN